MEDIIISKTNKTPAVHFNFADNHLTISGISIPEDADQFYTPLLDWITRYVELKKEQPTTIVLKLIYFNTSSSDYLVSVLKVLKTVSDIVTILPTQEKEEEEEADQASPHTDISDSPAETVVAESDSSENPEANTEADTSIEPAPKHPLTIEWHYEEEDEDMRETGTHFESIIEIPFVYVPETEIG
jgi:hypothetical protein